MMPTAMSSLELVRLTVESARRYKWAIPVTVYQLKEAYGWTENDKVKSWLKNKTGINIVDCVTVNGNVFAFEEDCSEGFFLLLCTNSDDIGIELMLRFV